MSEYALPGPVLAAMRAKARTHVARWSHVVARGTLEAKADRLVSEGLVWAFPGSDSADRSILMELPAEDCVAARMTERMRGWWSDELVAELAAMAAPRRARLAALFNSGAVRGALVAPPSYLPTQLSLWTREVRA